MIIYGSMDQVPDGKNHDIHTGLFPRHPNTSWECIWTLKTGCRIKKKIFKDQKKIILEGINHKFFRDQKKITLHENSTGSVSLRSWPDQKKIIRPGSLAKYDMKNCTQFWPGAHSVKMYETHRNTPCSDHCVAGFSCCWCCCWWLLFLLWCWCVRGADC